MTFAVFVPPHARDGLLPVVRYLSGLTCTHANVMDKGEYRRMASELSLVVVCPDTSPRGPEVSDEKDNWQARFSCTQENDYPNLARGGGDCDLLRLDLALSIAVAQPILGLRDL